MCDILAVGDERGWVGMGKLMMTMRDILPSLHAEVKLPIHLSLLYALPSLFRSTRRLGASLQHTNTHAAKAKARPSHPKILYTYAP
jgi:hypothetical protein